MKFECPVCIEEVPDTIQVRKRIIQKRGSCQVSNLKCGHSFCKKCIRSWILSSEGSMSCPMCRAQVTFKGKNMPLISTIKYQQDVTLRRCKHRAARTLVRSNRRKVKQHEIMKQFNGQFKENPWEIIFSIANHVGIDTVSEWSDTDTDTDTDTVSEWSDTDTVVV